MTDETVDCYNCGRPNPEWAQVCRSCGVALRHGEARVAPQGPFPTDRDSLISMGAVIGTILLAVLVGLFVSGLNPTEPTVGEATPTPSPTVEPTQTSEPDATPSPSPQPEATPTPLPGRLAFGQSLGEDGSVEEEERTFTPGMSFAYSITVEDGLGVSQIENEVVRIEEGGRPVVLPREAVSVDPESSTFGYVVGPADSLIDAWGSGTYQWRVYADDELIARRRFNLADG
jgi:hypothetical protein